MKKIPFHIMPLGEKALLIQVQEDPSEKLLHWLLSKKKTLLKLPDTEIILTYNELLIKFTNDTYPPFGIERKVEQILNKEEKIDKPTVVTHRIPVCYEPSLGIDMTEYAKAIDLPIPEIIEYHTRPIYTIYFLGFLPGFPYLEGLDKRLSLARKGIPSRKIAAGSIGIGGSQTGIYPQESPGGWHIIGQTPMPLFDVSKKRPSLFEAGDRLQFYAIDVIEFKKLIKASQSE